MTYAQRGDVKQKTPIEMRTKTSQYQQLCSVPGRTCMYDQNGACTTQGGVPEQKLETFSWQLTVPPASRRCPVSSDIRASISYVL